MFPVLHVGPLRFYTFGLLLGASICLGTWLFLRYFRRHGIVVNPKILALTLVGAGFVGAKLDNALVIGWHVLHHEALGTNFLRSGYTYLGCVLGGVLAGVFYIRVHRLPWLRTLDSLYCIAPAYALGRVGCFLAGDGDYGTASNLPWAVAFPHGVVPMLVRVHPTMLYSAAWEMCVFVAVSRMDAQRPRAGTLFACYLLATGGGRFCVEFLSRNPLLALHLTEAQMISLALLALGGCTLKRIRRPRQAAAFRAVRLTPDFPVPAGHADRA